MNAGKILRSVLTLGAIVALAACNSNNGSTTPTVAPTPLKIAGEYTGTVTDSVAGAGTAAVTLSQTGAAVGGTLDFTFGATTVANALAMNVTPAGSLSGTALAQINGATCAFALTGTYNASTNVISGNYSASSGCTGQSGTYSLTQQCTDPASAIYRRPMAILLPC